MNNKGVKLLAAVAVFAMVFAAFAVIDTDGVDAVKGEQEYNGTVTGYQPFPAGANVVINKNSTITGANAVVVVTGDFKVAEGVTLKIEKGGKLIIMGDSPKVIIDGNVDVIGNADNTGIFIKTTSDDTPNFKESGVTINGSVSVSGTAVISSDIPAISAANIDEDDNDNYASILISKNASLTVKKLGSSAATINKMNVFVAVGGSFTYAGAVSGDKGMKVSAYGDGTNKVYTSATITAGTATQTQSNMTFTVTSSSYNAYGVSADPQKTVFKDYALNVTGTLAGNDSILFERNVVKGDAAEKYSGPGDLFYKDIDSAKRANTADGNYISVEPGTIVLGTVIIQSLDVKEGSVFNNGTNTGDKNADLAKSTAIEVQGKLTFPKYDTSVNHNQMMNNGLIIVSGEVRADKHNFMNAGYTEFGPVYINGGSVIQYGFTGEIVTFNGVAYYDSDDNLVLVSDIQKAIDSAISANNSEIWIGGSFKSGLKDFEQPTDTNEKKGRSYSGAFVISSDITIPDGMTVNLMNGVVIKEGVTLTVSENAYVDHNDTSITNIDVKGKLVDKSFGVDTAMLNFEVRSTDADSTQWTYCSLRTALEETTSGTITVYNNINLESDLTIPENVTVEFEEEGTYTFTFGYNGKNATLTVNGILNLDENTIMIGTKGKIVLNNLIRYTGTEIEDTDRKVAGAYFTADILEDDDGAHYISSVSIAAQNSAEINGDITIFGGLSFGDVTFTAGDDGLTVYIVNSYDARENKLASGNITLVGATLDMTGGYYTGTVQATVTAGTSGISFDKSKGAVVGIDSEILVDGTETSLYIYSGAATHVDGTVTIESGDITVGNDDVKELKMLAGTFGGKPTTGKLIVKTGATLTVPKEVTFQLADPQGVINNQNGDVRLTLGSLGEYIEKNTTFTLDGTMNVAGTVQYGVSVINGDLNILKNGAMSLSVVANNGSIIVDSETTSGVAVEIMSVTGIVDGKLEIRNYNDNSPVDYGMILAYAGSDISAMDLGNNVKKTEITLNIDVTTGAGAFVTVFTNSDELSLKDVMKFIDIENYDVEGFYADPDFKTTVTNAKVGSPETVYAKMSAADVPGKISAVNGMKIYIDNLDVSNFKDNDGVYKLPVGTHTVEVQVQPGYEAEPIITFNGKTVTDGKIVIEAGMEEFVLTATGDVTVAGGNSGSSSDDGMGITDYLLIVLVVLAAILVVIVALRMMRS